MAQLALPPGTGEPAWALTVDEAAGAFKAAHQPLSGRSALAALIAAGRMPLKGRMPALPVTDQDLTALLAQVEAELLAQQSAARRVRPSGRRNTRRTK
ncbi:hypothetical protein Psi01_58910 [Planobispora siamensis]|uniref:Uncharacterized protein n=2 Tax=Planobispora siamensis TaxID=936338 RepID=A0A8J3SIR4_9ACTN|nr:hypothetical protein Psi01_58910 [Planobispora siamensis]